MNNSSDCSRIDVVSARELRGGPPLTCGMEAPNFAHFSLGEAGIARALAARSRSMLLGVSHVLALRAVDEIARRVVASAAVNMADLIAIWTRAYKGFRYQRVNVPVMSAVAVKRNGFIPMPSNSGRQDARSSAHLPHVGHRISPSEPFYVPPDFLARGN
jgi:hypothetical protein